MCVQVCVFVRQFSYYRVAPVLNLYQLQFDFAANNLSLAPAHRLYCVKKKEVMLFNHYNIYFLEFLTPGFVAIALLLFSCYSSYGH